MVHIQVLNRSLEFRKKQQRLLQSFGQNNEQYLHVICIKCSPLGQVTFVCLSFLLGKVRVILYKAEMKLACGALQADAQAVHLNCSVKVVVVVIIMTQTCSI